jgi:Uri superfamily endonuclease
MGIHNASMSDYPVPIGGRYALVLVLENNLEIDVGALGPVSFPKGRYLYSGSALNGLMTRLSRHADREKTVHWHIDLLTSRADVSIEGAVVRPVAGLDECGMITRALTVEGVHLLHPRFGASDHRCQGHLVHMGSDDDTAMAVRDVLASACPGARWLDVSVFRDRGAVIRRRR